MGPRVFAAYSFRNRGPRLLSILTACGLCALLGTGCPTPSGQPSTSARVVVPWTPDAPEPEPAPVPEPEAAPDPYRQLARELTANLNGKPIALIVGEFFLGEGETVTALSSRIQAELSYMLTKVQDVSVITRERLSELQLEERFQGSQLVEPGTSVANVKVRGCEAIVRGRYYPGPDGTRVLAELVYLEGGEKVMGRATLPVDATQGLYMAHEDQARQDANVGRIARNVEAFPSDIHLEITTPGTGRLFRQGDRVSFMVRADRDCYILALGHQSDGQTVVLFPNRYARNSHIEGGKWVEIPGTRNFDIVVQPPYGTDVIQVVACSEESAFHAKVSQMLGQHPDTLFVAGDSARGVGVYHRDSASQTALWGSKKMAISTAPKQK